MKSAGKLILSGSVILTVFAVWTLLIQAVDVRPVGVNGTSVGFATLNSGFHSLTGVDMRLYNITDWLGLVPVAVCMLFGLVGLLQLIKRKSLFKVDYDIIISGIYYIFVIAGYLIFEMIPINYRPILINGIAEASYPSSTTLLVLSVMPTLVFLTQRRIKSGSVRTIIRAATMLFSCFMVLGRLISGVHWLTDIIGSVLLSVGVFYVYKGVTLWISARSCRRCEKAEK
ncbi:MAG: phosphatase PAP2 family protein [Clostridia bacterium]|nr:phosphatase PAP2 family protein [Clostridia bacterium]